MSGSSPPMKGLGGSPPRDGPSFYPSFYPSIPGLPQAAEPIKQPAAPGQPAAYPSIYGLQQGMGSPAVAPAASPPVGNPAHQAAYPSMPGLQQAAEPVKQPIGTSQPASYPLIPSSLQEAAEAGMYVEDMEVRFREGFSDFRMDPGARLQRALSQAAAANRHGRRRWDAGGSGGGYDGGSPGSPHPGGGGGGAPTGHIIRMKRSEAWGKFLAYEGCCQVCMREGAKGVQEASYFLESGCESLRAALGITGLLLPTVSPSELAAAVAHGNGAVDVGNEILWDDSDAADKKLSAAAFMNHMSLLKLRVARLAMPGKGWLSQLCKKNSTYSHLTVLLRMAPSGGPADARLMEDLRFRLAANGAALPGSPQLELQPDQQGQEVVLEITDGVKVLARGAISCRRVWQIGMQHASVEDDGSDLEGVALRTSVPGSSNGGGVCSWFQEGSVTTLRPGAVGLWVHVYSEEGTSGQVLLSVQRQQRAMPSADAARSGVADATPHRTTLKVSSCQAYDSLLMAALRSQHCDKTRLEVCGEWAWLLEAFASLYGVRSNYAIMCHLRWVLTPGIATAHAMCFDLLSRKLAPLLQQECMPGSLTPQEATMLSKIKRDTEVLLKAAFENYYLINSHTPKGIMESGNPQQAPCEFPPAGLVAGVHLFETLRDALLPNDVEWLGDRFKVAAKARWARLMATFEDGSPEQRKEPGTSPLLAAPLRQHLKGGALPNQGKAAQVYHRVVLVASAIMQDLDYDRQLQEVPGLLPSCVHLPAVTAAEYATNFVHQLRTVLAQYPPNQPTEPAINMLVAVATLQRYLDEGRLAVPRGHPGHIDALELFGPHVRSWITTSQENLCAACNSLEATTELGSVGTATAAPLSSTGQQGGVAPIAKQMLANLSVEMHRYERVIQHWPLFGPYLEAALCVVLRTVIGAVSRQCGMTRVRNPANAPGEGYGSGSKGSPYGRGGPGGYGSSDTAHNRPKQPQSSAQYTWHPDSPRRAAAAPRILLMVREAVLLNSLKGLMLAVPSYEATILGWSGGYSAPPPGPPQTPLPRDAHLCADDVAPHLGAQFAQVVKELRTEYSAAVATTSQRLSSGLASSAGTSVVCILQNAKAASVGQPQQTQNQQLGMMEALSRQLFSSLEAALANLEAALDGRVFVAVGRGLWDYIGRDLFAYVENLQEGFDHRGAWRTRQHAALLLGLINSFFQGGLLVHLEHALQDRDLSVPLHIEATQKLLASNTTALNQSFTPF